ncbi:hypothetical protein M422DRAFT_30655 [Sphaerobolus stellatus SS14]|uniref:Mog1p/PsbP-like protein n=1 Tax=Sphaerobolus stellatus (strain SS14) TaxID=990650 RepID=A0A0C9VYP5_SPHS4|nr:hypothetical protein M422DRAFT_30655 [Sphaerobolus stellatus SS14]
MATAQRELFGGAITMQVPLTFMDASDLRQIPDTQEVFLAADSDFSLIVEILQRVDTDSDEAAAKFHFDSLAHDNAATSHTVHEVILPSAPQPAIPPAMPLPIILSGEQEVRKFNHTIPDRVWIFLAVYRVKVKNTDVVLTANIPYSVEGFVKLDEVGLNTAKQLFDSAAKSLKIVDFGLFA